jgi:hypothetical protein
MRVAGLPVLDLRPDRNVDHDQVEAAFEEAVEYLHEPDPRYFRLVVTAIAQINVYDVPHESLVWWSRHLNTPLPASVRRNTFYLACRLVWAASYFDALSQVPFLLRPFTRKAARKVAEDTWIQFVRQFPDSDEWVSYLQAHE